MTGGSQGDGISIAVAALVPNIAAAMPDAPFLSEFPRAITFARIETRVGRSSQVAARRGLLSTREAQAVERALVAQRLHQLDAAAAG